VLRYTKVGPSWRGKSDRWVGLGFPNSGCVEGDGWRKMYDELIKVGVIRYIASFQDCEALSSKTIETNELTNHSKQSSQTTAQLENAENPTQIYPSPHDLPMSYSIFASQLSASSLVNNPTLTSSAFSSLQGQ
jgi:hypothetical protein